MKIEKLIIHNGIIMNDSICGIPVKTMLIDPTGKPNVRTLAKLYQEDGVTIHNTGNYSPSADAEMHHNYFRNVENADKKYVGAHVFVDHDSIVQVCPINEKMFHAGDGKFGPGNTTTWALEICLNKHIETAHSNAKCLLAAYLLAYPDKQMFSHKKWSGKNCPQWILDNGKMEDFYNDVYSLVKAQDPIQEVSEWAVDAQAWVMNNGISDGERPKDPVTREELWTMLYRFNKMKG